MAWDDTKNPGDLIQSQDWNDLVADLKTRAKNFLDLLDTPSSYTGFGGKIVSVKTTEDGLEFIDAPSGGSGGGIPYRIVAASDASEESKAKAHYVCDGTNDEEEIQSAVDDLPAQGGIVFLTEGTFNIPTTTDVPTIDTTKPLMVIGSGMDVTSFSYSSMSGRGIIFHSSDNLVLSNFSIPSNPTVSISVASVSSGKNIYLDKIKGFISLGNTSSGEVNSSVYINNSVFTGKIFEIIGKYSNSRIKKVVITNSTFTNPSISSFPYMYANNLYIINSIFTNSSGTSGITFSNISNNFVLKNVIWDWNRNIASSSKVNIDRLVSTTNYGVLHNVRGYINNFQQSSSSTVNNTFYNGDTIITNSTLRVYNSSSYKVYIYNSKLLAVSGKNIFIGGGIL